MVIENLKRFPRAYHPVNQQLNVCVAENPKVRTLNHEKFPAFTVYEVFLTYLGLDLLIAN